MRSFRWPTLGAVGLVLNMAPGLAFGQPTIHATRIGDIVEIETFGCHCQGSGGHDCDSTGEYVAPYGFSVLDVKPIVRASHRGDFRITEHTAPGFIYIKDISSADFSSLLNNLAKETEGSSDAVRLLSIAAVVSTIRVVNSTSHAVVKSACHAESHKASGFLGSKGHDNGNIGVDWKLSLLRQPVKEDFDEIMLEIIKYTQDQSSERFDKILSTLEAVIEANKRVQ